MFVSSARRRHDKALERAKASAAGMLLQRPHSKAELRRKLADRGHADGAVDAAVARLQELVRRPAMPLPALT